MKTTTVLIFEDSDRTIGFKAVQELESEGWVVDIENCSKTKKADFIEHRIFMKRTWQ